MQPPIDPENESPILSRRKFVKLGATAIGSSLILNHGSGAESAATSQPAGLRLPLSDATGMRIDGPHRFITVGGWRGFQPTSVTTQAKVQTTAHRAPHGSLAFWFSPLESLDFYGLGEETRQHAPGAQQFPLVSDTFPGREAEKMAFGMYWNGSYPQLVSKFCPGNLWPQLDYGMAPFVYAERLTLRRGCWYSVVLTWDKPAKKLRLYVNGRRMGYCDTAKQFGEFGETLFLGNTMMLMRELTMTPTVMEEEEVAAQYKQQRPAGNKVADEDIHRTVDPRQGAPLDLKRDASWKEAYACGFDKKADLAAWIYQTGDAMRSKFTVETSPEGLLIATPSEIANDSRMYLWSPRSFEGNQWIEYDFRLEGPNGLALLVACCRGAQREDFINDYPLQRTGGMGVILSSTSNYHWEYMRRVEIMRRDVETQYVSKNPWHWRMHYGCIPAYEQNRWYRMRLIKHGDRLHGSIDGKTVFDVIDQTSSNNGPSLNYGRVGFRQMYDTTMRFRNFSVYEQQT